MKLEDLKQGMVCRLRNGETIIAVSDAKYYRTSVLYFKNEYNEDLTHKVDRILDIVSVRYGEEEKYARVDDNNA